MSVQDFTENKQEPTPHFLAGYGVNDVNPLTSSHEMFRLNGLNIAFGIFQRLSGKRLTKSYNPSAVTSIHSCNNGKVLIQTDSQLIFADEYELQGDPIIDDNTGQVIISDTSPYDVVFADPTFSYDYLQNDLDGSYLLDQNYERLIPA